MMTRAIVLARNRNKYLDLFEGLFIHDAARDVGSISNLGVRHFEGTVFLKKQGAFSKVERVLLFCLLKNLEGRCPQCLPPPGSYVYGCCFEGS